jgi:putative FmdB family regulatory protein
MPMYAYRCDACGHEFDVRASFADKDAGLEPTCPRVRTGERDR